MKDSFGREIDYLRVSLTDRCNYRCVYCMKETGVEKKSHSDILTLEETYSIIEAFVALGGKKVRFTGGEPLVRKNAISLIERVGKLSLDKMSLTTNGVYLPEYADRLKEAGISAVNISIDSIDEDKYRFVTVGGNLNDALNGLKKAKELFDVKINAVLMKGINDDVRPFAEFAADNGVLLRFIELMPFAENDSYQKYGVPATEIIEKKHLSLSETVGNTDYYAFDDGIKVGFIRPLSHKFCGGCNRLRLTSDGKILPCLHGDAEIDIKPYLKSGSVTEGLLKAISIKPACHKMDGGIWQTRKMNYIGG